MNFKSWYSTISRDMHDDDFTIPYITIKNGDHYEIVIENLERLGFLDGNDFSKYGVPVTYVDIWYNDFWNSHISEKNSCVNEFEFSLEDIISLPRRDDF